MLQLEAEELLQHPAQELSIDWHLYEQPTPSIAGDPALIQEGVLVAALRREVRNHVGLLTQAGLYPVIVDVGCMALANLFFELKNIPKESATGLVYTNSRTVDFAIIDEGGFILPRQLYSFDASWQQKVSGLADDIQMSLKFYHYELRRHPVAKIYLSGLFSRDRHFLDELRKKISVPIEAWDPLAELSVDRAPRHGPGVDGTLYAISLGLIYQKGAAG